VRKFFSVFVVNISYLHCTRRELKSQSLKIEYLRCCQYYTLN